MEYRHIGAIPRVEHVFALADDAHGLLQSKGAHGMRECEYKTMPSQ